ncbi:hypothetical protein GCM10010305_39810 [Streptomyces termitum]|uniref:Uncharacterized protein n=1 Tax=Streptomyces termitum TaxID=67368 RepID=A0A918T4K0_9ACTN|nr:hypothetical protein GCM10010305_39810 [Streptomyces termitum]
MPPAPRGRRGVVPACGRARPGRETGAGASAAGRLTERADLRLGAARRTLRPGNLPEQYASGEFSAMGCGMRGSCHREHNRGPVIVTGESVARSSAADARTEVRILRTSAS